MKEEVRMGDRVVIVILGDIGTKQDLTPIHVGSSRQSIHICEFMVLGGRGLR